MAVILPGKTLQQMIAISMDSEDHLWPMDTARRWQMPAETGSQALEQRVAGNHQYAPFKFPETVFRDVSPLNTPMQSNRDL
jgi:hypothetical protein